MTLSDFFILFAGGNAFFNCLCNEEATGLSGRFQTICTCAVQICRFYLFIYFNTYVHFLEILESSVNHNIILVRPEHGGHVHLERGTCRRYQTFFFFSLSYNEPHLTLLFSLCSTPIKRTLRGYRWASMSEPQRLGSVSDVAAALFGASQPLCPALGVKQGCCCRCICTRSSFRCGRVTHRKWEGKITKKNILVMRRKVRRCSQSPRHVWDHCLIHETLDASNRFSILGEVKQHVSPPFLQKYNIPLSQGETDSSDVEMRGSCGAGRGPLTCFHSFPFFCSHPFI